MNLADKKKYIRLAAVLGLILSTIVALGWLLRVPALTSLLPGQQEMKFNAALLFLFTNITLIAIANEKWHRLKLVLSLALIFTGFTTLLQVFISTNLGIDELFVKDDFIIRTTNYPPGRMAHGASFAFILFGLGFLLMGSKQERLRKLAQYCFHIITLISFLVIIGFLLKVPVFNDIPTLKTMSFHTAFIFFINSIAASLWNEKLGFTGLFTGNGVGNIMARQLFPAFTIAVILVSILRIYLFQKGILSVELGIILLTTVFILIGLVSIALSAKQLNKINIKKNIAEDQISNLNKNLELIVQERTDELYESVNALQDSKNELWKSEQLLKGIIDNADAAIFVKDIQGVYLLVNKRFAEDFNMQIDEIIGKTTFQIFPEDLASKLVSNESAIISSKESQTAETTAVFNGSSKTMLINKFPLFDESNAVFAICGIATDFSDIRKSRTEQEILSFQLQQKNQQLLNFAHITSHNLRSPVSNLNSLLWLYKESQTEEERAILFEKFETVIHNLSETLNELVDALKIQEDTGRKRESLLFEDVFKKVRDSMIGKIMETEAVVSYNFTKAPAIEYPRLYLESILQNLLSNSLKYRSPQRTPVIFAETLFENGILILRFKDNGLGIDLNRHSDKLFGLNKTFHRHEEAKGVGLFITKTQVEAMGGSITVESEVEKGSTFIVYFNAKHH